VPQHSQSGGEELRSGKEKLATDDHGREWIARDHSSSYRDFLIQGNLGTTASLESILLGLIGVLLTTLSDNDDGKGATTL
jgi:hypothetical protein